MQHNSELQEIGYMFSSGYLIQQLLMLKLLAMSYMVSTRPTKRIYDGNSMKI